jgi:hypothetical protein
LRERRRSGEDAEADERQENRSRAKQEGDKHAWMGEGGEKRRFLFHANVLMVIGKRRGRRVKGESERSHACSRVLPRVHLIFLSFAFSVTIRIRVATPNRAASGGVRQRTDA